MRCDDFRKSVTGGEPLDDATRGHLAACPACGAEFAELRALTSLRPSAPDALRDRVLAAFPARRISPWPGLARAAAMLMIGLVGGFAGGYVAKAPKDRVVVVEKRVEVDAPVSDDYVFNVSVAADYVYGKARKVEIRYEGMNVERIVVDPDVKTYEQYCPVARQLGSLAAKRPDIVVYRKRDF